MKMKNVILGLMLAMLVLVAGCANELAGGSVVEEGPIKIGYLGPLSGDAIQFGEGALQAVIMAVEEINENGGVNGRLLEIVAEDGKCAGKESALAANKMVNQDKVSVIIGGQCSAETLAAAPIAEEGKVVILSSCSSAPKVSDAGDYIFRIYPSDSYQGIFVADHVFDDLGHRKAAILFTNGDWGIGIKDAFKNRFQEIGGEILAEESFEQDATDMRSQLAKIKAVDADILYMPAYPQGAGLILKQAKEIGLDIPMFGADASDAPDVVSIAGDAAEGFELSIVAAVPSEAVKQKYEEKFGHGFIVCGLQAYDAPHLVASIIEEVGSDSSAIKDALYNADFDGEIGKIRFDENGDLIGANYHIRKVVDGEFVVKK